jgi:hypothetical protein
MVQTVIAQEELGPYEGLSAAQSRWPCRNTLNAKQALQPIEQDILHEGDHLPLDGHAVERHPQRHHPHLVQSVAEAIPQGPFIQPVHPIDQWLATQAECHPRIIATSYLPTQALGQVLPDRVSALPRRPPPSADRISAIEGSGPQSKAFGYAGTSVSQAISP